ncbi:alpha/beta hydrolase [Aquabacterium sp.]|uniref:alpha/beta hydrolase n=1 Tax=Aquabacterium sp. TaxID=1872578 RepID=UPI0027B8DE21|nr:alpha/beta hydrolase [Aquabacterium sp.]
MPHRIPATVRTRDGLDLHVHHWPLPPDVRGRGVALIVHGLGEHAGRYAHVAAHLNRQGWSVVSYDHRGHGQSPGARGVLKQDDDLLHDLASAIDLVRAGYPGQRLLLVGHSLGGAVAARFVAAQAGQGDAVETAVWARPVDALVLSSPALAIPLSAVQKVLLNTVARLTPDLAVGNGLKPEWVCHNPATVAAYSADPLVHDRISGRLSHFLLDAGAVVRQRTTAWRTPTLIMWGLDDRCVDPAGSAAFAAAAPAQWVTSHPWPGLAHEIFNEVEQDQVLQTLSDWLAGVFAG